MPTGRPCRQALPIRWAAPISTPVRPLMRPVQERRAKNDGLLPGFNDEARGGREGERSRRRAQQHRDLLIGAGASRRRESSAASPAP